MIGEGCVDEEGGDEGWSEKVSWLEMLTWNMRINKIKMPQKKLLPCRPNTCLIGKILQNREKKLKIYYIC